MSVSVVSIESSTVPSVVLGANSASGSGSKPTPHAQGAVHMTAVEAKLGGVSLLVVEWQTTPSEITRRNLGNRILGLLQPLFRKVASRFTPSARGSLALEDLEQVAAIEAFKCLSKYDAARARSTTFEAFVYRYAKQRCAEHVRLHATDVHVSDWTGRGRKAVNGVERTGKKSEDRVTVHSTSDVHNRETNGAAMADGYGPRENGVSGTWGDSAEDVDTPEALLEGAQTSAELAEAIARLPAEKRDLVREAFGIGTTDPASLRDIARRRRVPRSRLATELEEVLVELRQDMECQ